MKRLFEPIKIGNVELKNRIVMAPMATQYTNRGFQVFFIGDCVQPRRILQAVREGATVGWQI